MFIVFECYHPLKGKLNNACDKDIEFEKVCSLKAQNLSQAFQKCQNDFSRTYSNLDIRSTSVGDCFRNMETGQVFMITGTEFKELPFINKKMNYE